MTQSILPSFRKLQQRAAHVDLDSLGLDALMNKEPCVRACQGKLLGKSCREIVLARTLDKEVLVKQALLHRGLAYRQILARDSEQVGTIRFPQAPSV